MATKLLLIPPSSPLMPSNNHDKNPFPFRLFAIFCMHLLVLFTNIPGYSSYVQVSSLVHPAQIIRNSSYHSILRKHTFHATIRSNRRGSLNSSPINIINGDTQALGSTENNNNITIPSTSATTSSTNSSSTKTPSSKSIILPKLSSSDKDDAFTTISSLAALALLKSDMKRDAVGKDAGSQSSSATNWIDDQSSFVLQKAMDKLLIKLPDQRLGLDRDEALNWIRWMKSSPTPLIIDLSSDLRIAANSTISDHVLNLIGTTRYDFFHRMGCNLILLPSGEEMKSTFTEPTGGIIFGKLLYGGASRFRLLPSSSSSSKSSQQPRRRAGERTVVKDSIDKNIPSWIQFGGSDRKYQALDMGSAAVLEISLFPQGKSVPSLYSDNLNSEDIDVDNGTAMRRLTGDMILNKIYWSPCKMFEFEKEDDENLISSKKKQLSIGGLNPSLVGSSPMSLSGKNRNDAFKNDFRSSVGGLQTQIDAIVRRVLDGRVIRPTDEESILDDDSDGIIGITSSQLSQATLEAEELALLGLTPVRGLLLYGPPGCGKTALAREISKALRARTPKIVSAPELLDRWVGGSEKLIRNLFSDAEAELAACNGDASKSALHVIVIDEIDAVFRKRSSSEDSGEATRSSAVNQILAKLDGVNAIPNVLMIGMTNRRELLDEALLRPGRLEVQIEIPLPDKEGRREILNIHFEALRAKGRLSKPLCSAIDGVFDFNDDEVIEYMGKKRDKIRRLLKKISAVNKKYYDLASMTEGFSGADIAGLVRCAASIALSRARSDGYGIEGLIITLQDVEEALIEVKR